MNKKKLLKNYKNKHKKTKFYRIKPPIRTYGEEILQQIPKRDLKSDCVAITQWGLFADYVTLEILPKRRGKAVLTLESVAKFMDEMMLLKSNIFPESQQARRKRALKHGY